MTMLRIFKGNMRTFVIKLLLPRFDQNIYGKAWSKMGVASLVIKHKMTLPQE